MYRRTLWLTSNENVGGKARCQFQDQTQRVDFDSHGIRTTYAFSYTEEGNSFDDGENLIFELRLCECCVHSQHMNI